MGPKHVNYCQFSLLSAQDQHLSEQTPAQINNAQSTTPTFFSNQTFGFRLLSINRSGERAETITPTPQPKGIIIVILCFVIINKEHKMHKTAHAFIELPSTSELWSAA